MKRLYAQKNKCLLTLHDSPNISFIISQKNDCSAFSKCVSKVGFTVDRKFTY